MEKFAMLILLLVMLLGFVESTIFSGKQFVWKANVEWNKVTGNEYGWSIMNMRKNVEIEDPTGVRVDIYKRSTLGSAVCRGERFGKLLGSAQVVNNQFEFTLDGDGTDPVFVKFKDEKGHILSQDWYTPSKDTKLESDSPAMWEYKLNHHYAEQNEDDRRWHERNDARNRRNGWT
ncbi:hypothetical protein Ddc_23793 [Ditylenchus destructor]|nr:hypothetical protein Ddc_23793 [Ditylenchus destructor]